MPSIVVEGDGRFPMDVKIPILNYHFTDNGVAVIVAQGEFEGRIAGVEIQVRGHMEPAIIDEEMDTITAFDKGVVITATADKTTLLTAIFSKIYKIPASAPKLLKALDLTTIALDGDPRDIERQHVNFKVFHDDEGELGLYFEMFLHVNIPEGWIRFDEKDEEYRNNVVKAFASLREPTSKLLQ